MKPSKIKTDPYVGMRRIYFMDSDHYCQTATYQAIWPCNREHSACRKCIDCGIEYHVIKVLPK
jgi:hypothetical protein